MYRLLWNVLPFFRPSTARFERKKKENCKSLVKKAKNTNWDILDVFSKPYLQNFDLVVGRCHGDRDL